MGRYSPSVLPENTNGPSFLSEMGDAAEGIAGALEGRRVRKRQEHLDQQADQDRTRRIGHEDEAWGREREASARQKLLDAVTLYQSGYREGAAPTDNPTGQPGGEGGEQLAAAIDARRGGPMIPGQPTVQEGQPAAADPRQPLGRPEWGNMVQGQAGVTQSAGRVPTENYRAAAPQPGGTPFQADADFPMDQGISTPLYPSQQAGGSLGPTQRPTQLGVQREHPMTTYGARFYKLPGVDGYIDTEGTPEARKQRYELEQEDRRFGHDRDIEGLRSTNAQALEDRRQRGDLELEDRRNVNETGRDRLKYAQDTRHEREETRRAESVARIRAGASGGNDGPTGPKTLDARGRMISRQISDRSKALNEEGEQLDMEADPDSTNFHRIASELDSLRGVQDQVTAARGGSPDAVKSISRQMNAQSYQQEVSALASRRARLLAKAAGNPELIARINQAYSTDVNGISRKYGSVLGDH